MEYDGEKSRHTLCPYESLGVEDSHLAHDNGCVLCVRMGGGRIHGTMRPPSRGNSPFLTWAISDSFK